MLEVPRAAGYSMPAEWETHAATWLGWPHNSNDWPGKLDTIRWVYAEIARKISPGETVRMLVNDHKQAAMARDYLFRAGVELDRVEFVTHPTDRGWTRDCGPIFVRRSMESNLETAIVHFHFNGWANYGNWRKDNSVPLTAAKELRRRIFDSRAGGRKFVLEGGGIEVNGHGTLLTTEECYLSPKIQVRNRGLKRAGFEKALRDYLGVTNVFWLGRGITGDDTHGHIDDICRFVSRRTLVMAREDDPEDANYRPLSENWERIQDLRLEDGSKPDIAALPMPAPLFFKGERLPASYANFYICNEAMLVPTFNDPHDRYALGLLSELFHDRPVVGIHAVDLVLGLGTLHCLTQQQPAESDAPGIS